MNKILADQDYEPSQGLEAGTKLLNGQFLLHSRLQAGGFGITYIARDSLDRQVVVKECFPSNICTRSNGQVIATTPLQKKQFEAIKKQFIREARQVAKLIHRNIVAIHQVFEENNTAYMALDQVEGEDLLTTLENNPEKLTNEYLHNVLDQMLAAIAYTHDHNLLHRDISPDNILMDEDGHLTLIDFGAARELHVNPNSNVPCIMAVKDGYSPHEFYSQTSNHDNASDFYSLGATLYHLITGVAAPSSYERLTAISRGEEDPYISLVSGDWPVDYNLQATIDRAMQLLQKSRFSSASEWAAEMERLPTVKPSHLRKHVFDPNLEVKIADLVKKTNELLQANNAPSQKSNANLSDLEKLKAETKKRQTIVDIFGNPIHDVDKWQAEQEKEVAEAKAKRQSNGAKADDKTPSEAAKTSPRVFDGGLLTSILARCLPPKKSSSNSNTTFLGDNR